MEKKVIILKLGGSLITDKTIPFRSRLVVIRNLCRQIKKAYNEDKKLQLLIGHGSGSFAHVPATKYQMQEGIKNKKQKIGFCEVQDAAASLNRIVVSELIKAGVLAISVNPSSMMIAKGRKIVEFFDEPILEAIRMGLTPVFYGDIVFDKSQGSAIFSTEQLIAEIVKKFRKKNITVSRVIQNGITKGVLDQKGKVIAEITKKNYPKLRRLIFKTEGFDVTGGMKHKLEEALTMTHYGLKTMIINGSLKNNLLRDAILSRPIEGTLVK